MANLERAVPFAFEGGPEKVLLIHGFTGSPAEMLELGTELNKAGYTVRGPLLPGHGTKLEDLARVSWRDWVDCAHAAYLELAADGSPVHVCGNSMGGTLSLHLATHFRVASLTVYSAPIYLTDWRLKFLPVLKHLLPAVPKPREGENIKCPKARASFVGYDADPPLGVAQLLELIEHTKVDLGEIRSPTLLMHAVEDARVPYGCMKRIREGIGASAPVTEVTLTDCYHVITIDQEKQKVFAETLRHLRAHPARRGA